MLTRAALLSDSEKHQLGNIEIDQNVQHNDKTRQTEDKIQADLHTSNKHNVNEQYKL